MTQMRLVGFEACALRRADSLNDGDLAAMACQAIRTLIKHEARPQTFRELAAASLVLARRMDSDRSDEPMPSPDGIWLGDPD